MSLRTRLVLAVGTVLFLALTLLGVLGGRLLYNSRVNDLGRELLERWSKVEQAAEVTRNYNIGSEVLDALKTGSDVSDARVYGFSSFNPQNPDWESGFRKMPTLNTYGSPTALLQHGGWLMVSALSRSGTLVIQVGTPLGGLNRTLELYVRDTVLLLLSILVFATLALYWVTSKSLEPLERLKNRVLKLDSDAPIPSTNQNDEVGELARALERSVKEIRQTREFEQRFLQVASHELRTPVAAMRAELELSLSRKMRDGPEGGPPREVAQLGQDSDAYPRTRDFEGLERTLKRVYGSAQHLERLTQNLLVLGRVQGLPLRREKLDFLALCGEIVDRMQPLAIKKGLDLTLEGQPFALEGDPLLLSRTLENLLYNAIRFTESGFVRVTVQNPELALEDSGPGFPIEVLEGFSSVPKGDLGIGLQVVREVVRAHNGTLTIKNLEPQGSRVTLNFDRSSG